MQVRVDIGKAQSGVYAVLLAVGVLSIAATAQATTLFATSGECRSCHTSDGTALVDSEGNSLSIYDDWSATMMGNAFHDPLFQAKVESEVVRHPHLQAVIEDKCTTCHAPMGRTQAHWDGATYYSLAEARSSAIGTDGVSCTLCHQVQAANLGAPKSFSGGFVIDDSRVLFGPYANVLTGPMISSVNYIPKVGQQASASELCATCHTLFTPYVDDAGEVVGTFPEQTPYLEWLNSIYSDDNSTHASCQDCHMPRVDEDIQISRRPPWFDGTQNPFWKHHFVGGNTLLLTLLRDNALDLGVTASTQQFDVTLTRTTDQLTGSTATLTLADIQRSTEKVAIVLSVQNLTGHKLPTGFPSRRVWIRFTATGSGGRTILDSGAWNADFEIVGLNDGFEPHYDIISASDQVQIYEPVMGDVNDDVTYTLLRAARYLKDNRLPPRGFRSDDPAYEHTAIYGAAASDQNFNRDLNGEGTGSDRVTYELPAEAVRGPVDIRATLLFQTVTPRLVQDLSATATPATEVFTTLYDEADNPPVTLSSLSFKLSPK